MERAYVAWGGFERGVVFVGGDVELAEGGDGVLDVVVGFGDEAGSDESKAGEQHGKGCCERSLNVCEVG